MTTRLIWPEDLYELGMNLHTALRKCCDSPETSLAYNVIHASDEEWTVFLRALYKWVEEWLRTEPAPDSSPPRMANCMRNFLSAWTGRRGVFPQFRGGEFKDDEIRKTCSLSLLCAIGQSLAALSDSDLQAMFTYLYPQI